MVQQRLGESDEDYQKRKRRVRLQMMVSPNFLAHGGGSAAESFANACMTVGNDATWYGYTQTFGDLVPTTLNNGQTITEIKAKADGSWIMKIDAGVQITDVDEVYLVSDDGEILVVLTWDTATNVYIALDPEEAADLIALDGLEFCFGLYALPNLFIHYSMGELE